ncbi:MAG: glycosyltransferase [Vicinamibacterales bacterium]
MKIAYFSPLRPCRTAVADYSEELLPHLARHAEVDLFVDGYEPSSQAIRMFYRVVDCSGRGATAVLDRYDAVIYQAGNSGFHEYILRQALRHPGIVVLHDYSLHGLFAEITLARGFPQEYIQEMEACHGADGRRAAEAVVAGLYARLWETAPLRYPLNRRLIEASQAVVVLSKAIGDLVKAANPNVLVRLIRPHCESGPTEATPSAEALAELRQRYGIGAAATVIATVGFVTSAQRIPLVLEAVAAVAARYDVHYLMVGGRNPHLDFGDRVRELGLEGRVHVTGHLPIDELVRCIHLSDICVQLKDPTCGEVSGSSCRVLGVGRPLVVFDAGWFKELPDSFCVKVEPGPRERDSLQAALEALVNDPARRAAMSERARAHHAQNYRADRSAAEYIRLINDLTGHGSLSWFAVKMSELGVGPEDEEFIREVAREVEALGLHPDAQRDCRRRCSDARGP